MEQITEIKQSVDIVSVVGRYIQLRKRGADYEGLCPFHADRKLGSFKVSPRKQICTCFSCGVTTDAIGFVMRIEGVGYPEAVKMLADKGGTQTKVLRREVEARVMAVIPDDIVRRTTINNRNALTNWLRALPWSAEQRERLEQVLWAYAVGTWRDGRVVFWQADRTGRVHSGKLMAYLPDGHRDKSRNPGWAHNQPEVKRVLAKGSEYVRTLFGMHLTRRYSGASINIVESEKTAIICAVAYGNMEKSLWLASGGLEGINREQLAELISEGRSIYLWPDRDAVAKWKEKAEHIGSKNVRVYTQFLNDWKEEDGGKADIADMLVRIMTQ